MIEWCGNFIAGGFWRAMLFVFMVMLFLGILRVVFAGVPDFIHTMVSGISFAAVFFIIWHIHHGIGWLIFGIILILGLIKGLLSKGAFQNSRNDFTMSEKPDIISEAQTARLIRKNKGKHPLYEIYNSLAINSGAAGERFRQEEKITEALECDFQGIALMEKAIELSREAPEEKQIQ